MTIYIPEKLARESQKPTVQWHYTPLKFATPEHVRNAFIIPEGKIYEVFVTSEDALFLLGFYAHYNDVTAANRYKWLISEVTGASYVYPCILAATWAAEGILGSASSVASRGIMMSENEAILELFDAHSPGIQTFVRWRDVTNYPFLW